MGATLQEFARVAAAMETVLAAERSTEHAIRQTQQAGALLIQEATERAAQITRRCDERVRRVHDRCAAALDERVAELLPATDPGTRRVADPSAVPLDAVLERVAAWLTSPE